MALGVALWVVVLALPEAAVARCRSRSDLLRLAASVRAELGCQADALGGALPGCSAPAPPACGRGAYDEILRVGLGGRRRLPQRAGTLAARRCQVVLARAVGRFAEHRLRERGHDRRRALGAKIPKKISATCDGVRVLSAGEGTFPRAGGACAPLTSGPGRAVDGPALERCVRASLEGIVDGVAPNPLRPNIVLVLSDDQRWDTLVYMPETWARIAGEGILFQNAFATTPSCSPSRASIHTGQIARRHGVIANGWEPAFDQSSTLAPALAKAGYVNGYFGKYMNEAEKLGPTVPPGWHEWNVLLEPSGGSYFGSRVSENGTFRTLGADEYSTDFLAARAVDFIRENAARPFFVVYAPYAAHDPWHPAPRHAGRFDGLPPHRPPSWREPDVSDKPSWVRFFARVADAQGALRRDEQRLRELETLLAVDEGVAAIDRMLERAGLRDQTLFVYASDHGIHWGEHWTGTKFTAYEESIRIPLLLRYPAMAPLPRSATELVATIDLAPTFAEAAGASLPGEPDGRSLFPLLGEDEPAWRRQIAIESLGGIITRGSRSLRTARWKYIEVDDDTGITTELYDLEADPYELTNLALDPAFAETREGLSVRLEAELP